MPFLLEIIVISYLGKLRILVEMPSNDRQNVQKVRGDAKKRIMHSLVVDGMAGDTRSKHSSTK